jgi:nucleoid DNA-binding protein
MAKAAGRPPTKTEIIGTIAESTGLSKKEVSSVFEALQDQIKKSMGRGGPGAFAIPGLVKITKKKVDARPAQKDWKNPFTGEVQTRPAKPAYTKIQVRALKNLKDMV